jgi:hypothetical protein
MLFLAKFVFVFFTKEGNKSGKKEVRDEGGDKKGQEDQKRLCRVVWAHFGLVDPIDESSFVTPYIHEKKLIPEAHSFSQTRALSP